MFSELDEINIEQAQYGKSIPSVIGEYLSGILVKEFKEPKDELTLKLRKCNLHIYYSDVQTISNSYDLTNLYKIYGDNSPVICFILDENVDIELSDIINYINDKSLIKFNVNQIDEFSVRNRFHKSKLYIFKVTDDFLTNIDIDTIIKQNDTFNNKNNIVASKLVNNKLLLKNKFKNIIEKYEEHLIFLKYGSKNKLKKFVSKITQSLPDKFETILNDDNQYVLMIAYPKKLTKSIISNILIEIQAKTKLLNSEKVKRIKDIYIGKIKDFDNIELDLFAIESIKIEN